MVSATLENIPQIRFTESTIRRMYQLVDKGKLDPHFQKIARQILGAAMPGQWKNYSGEAEALLQWCRSKIDYRRDPDSVEMVQDVWATLDRKAGDCDDFVVLLGALLESTGCPVRCVTVSTRPDGEWSHVYLEAFLSRRWTPIDPIMQGTSVGWAPADGITAKKVWTRETVGLSGYEENPTVEGYEMSSLNGKHDSNGYLHQAGSDMQAWGDNDDVFSGQSNMFEPTPPKGSSADISKTWARPMPGDHVDSKRSYPVKQIRTPADHINQPRADGGDYGSLLKPENFRDRGDLFHQVPKSYIPRPFDPNVFWGQIPDWQADERYLLPDRVVAGKDRMVDLAGYDFDYVVDVISRAVVETVRDAQRGNMAGLGAEVSFNLDQPSVTIDEPPLPPSEQPGAIDIWKLINKGIDAIKPIVGGSSPGTPPSYSVQPAPVKAGLGLGLPSWALPVALGGAFFLFAGSKLFGGGRRYRRNPSRRRRKWDGRAKKLPSLAVMAAAGGAVYLMSKPKLDAVMQPNPSQFSMV